MRIKYILSLLIISVSFKIYGQITLENTFPVAEPAFNPTLYYVNFSTGDKHAVSNGEDMSLNIYNINHSLYKSITVPTITIDANSIISNVYFYNISDNLFNSDSKVEYLVEYYTMNSVNHTSGYFVRVWDENGNSVFSKDSARVIGPTENLYKTTAVYNTSTGPKLAIQNESHNNHTIELYSLPGTLLSVNNSQKQDPGSLSYPMPNPSSELTRIEFKLPEGTSTGEIAVYSTKGAIVKKYIVDNTFGDLLLNNSDLPTGTYYYQLNAGSTSSEAKKMMVIK